MTSKASWAPTRDAYLGPALARGLQQVDRVAGYRKLEDYLKDRTRRTKFITVGQKSDAAYPANGPTGDVSITLGSRNSTAIRTARRRTSGARPASGCPRHTSRVCSRYYVDTDLDHLRDQRRHRPRGCIRSTATALRRATIPIISAATCGRRMPRSRSCGGAGLGRHAGHPRRGRQGRATCGADHRYGHYPPASDAELAHLRFSREDRRPAGGRILGAPRGPGVTTRRSSC